jgi:hypothetical protein
VLRGWVPGRRLKKGAGIHYENEGDFKAYEYADIEAEDESKNNPMLGQVTDLETLPTLTVMHGAPC